MARTSKLASLAALLRIHHWVKNLLVLVPLVTSQTIDSLSAHRSWSDRIPRCWIHLTQVTPRCSVGLGGGLPARPTRIRVSLCERGGLPRLSVRLAAGQRVSAAKVIGMSVRLAGALKSVQFSLRAANLRHRRHDLSRHTQAAASCGSGRCGPSQKNGASALGLQRGGTGQLRLALMHKLRRAMVRPGRERLTGLVEVLSLLGR